MNKLYLAGGCFWCISDYLLSFNGIKDVICGYSGGIEKDADYRLVKSQTTKHRETVEVIYDEAIIDRKMILDIYLSYVDPFDQNGQFIDKGYSYTLALYYRDEEEKSFFINVLEEFKKTVEGEIYISIEPFKFFIKAEEYHQHFSEKNQEEFLDEIKAGNRTCHLARFKK